MNCEGKIELPPFFGYCCYFGGEGSRYLLYTWRLHRSSVSLAHRLETGMPLQIQLSWVSAQGCTPTPAHLPDVLLIRSRLPRRQPGPRSSHLFPQDILLTTLPHQTADSTNHIPPFPLKLAPVDTLLAPLRQRNYIPGL